MISEETIGAIRFGYGPAGKGGKTAEALLASLAGGNAIAARYPMPSLAEVFEKLTNFRRLSKQKSSEMKLAGEFVGQKEELYAMARDGLLVSYARMVESTSPLFERLVWFWANHFTIAPGRGAARVMGAVYIEDAIRPFVTGRFGDMLRAVVTHPGMLRYLNQDTSMGPKSHLGMRKKRGLNENLARELLELHTLGVGAGYTQADVRQLAELLTGLTYNEEAGFFFQQEIAEPGAELVLGKAYGNGTAQMRFILEALEDLAKHPATARRIATKLATHFVADDPDPDLVAALEAAYVRSGGELLALYETLLSHPAAWRPPGAKVRQPLDYIAACWTAVGASGDELSALSTQEHNGRLWGPLNAMGQPFMEAPGPNGWPEEATFWITPQGLAQRIVFSLQVARRSAAKIADPRAFVDRALADAASEALRQAVDAATQKTDAIALVLASAEMNRR